MLAKILEEMWVEPAVLEALSEEQKRILFLKMREEQVRRWREREEREGAHVCSRPKTGARKHVTWLLGRDGDICVSVIGDLDELSSARLLRPRHRCHSDKGSVPRPTEADGSDGSDGDSSSDSQGERPPPLHRPRLSRHGNTAPLKAPLSEAELGSEDRGAVRLQRRNGGRVAQLSRAFAADPGCPPSSPSPSSPASSQAPGLVRPARSHGRAAALVH